MQKRNVYLLEKSNMVRSSVAICKAPIEIIITVLLSALILILGSCRDKKMKNSDYNVLVEDTIELLKEGKLEYPPSLVSSYAIRDVSRYPLIEAGKSALPAIRKKFHEHIDPDVKTYFLLSMFNIAQAEVNGDALYVLKNESDEELCWIASDGLSVYGTRGILPELAFLLEQEHTNSRCILAAAEGIAEVMLPYAQWVDLSEEQRFNKRKQYFLDWWMKEGMKTESGGNGSNP